MCCIITEPSSMSISWTAFNKFTFSINNLAIFIYLKYLEAAYKLVKTCFKRLTHTPIYIPEMLHRPTRQLNIDMSSGRNLVILRQGKIILMKNFWNRDNFICKSITLQRFFFLKKKFIAKLFLIEKWLRHVQETAVHVIHLPGSGSFIRAHDIGKMRETPLYSKELHNTYYTICIACWLLQKKKEQRLNTAILASVAMCEGTVFPFIILEPQIYFSLQLYSNWE